MNPHLWCTTDRNLDRNRLLSCSCGAQGTRIRRTDAFELEIEEAYLRPDALRAYMTLVRDVRNVGFEGVGHAPIMTHFKPFVEAVRAFLNEIDR
jgi:hypothetical protein